MNKYLKYFISLSILFILTCTLASSTVFAYFDPTKDCPGSTKTNPQISTGLGCLSTSTSGFTSTLLTFLASTAGAISLVIMLIATIQIMTGGDNAEQVKKGKELFTGAITGLLFIIFSVTLLKIIAGDIIKLPGFQGP
ncbi:hypothetical protein COW38_04265 [Candidatus Collierbacteria bacterium CG17_big_fil_post_rev_8_21_14_2_50_45_7]|uniref:Uncharacterized protein n=1 Tax=Candidatus Collierbacteria bacterium CG17_big_fil_post_rev_8_21_14_2_50_45_7 TaxID=1974536 RepID=A0A2M7FLK9_9BACT|nr:MAG: hypothetical protein COW38_04265 [Candidatus Collierbacteria bacterium CG17_big_fil_post_rev_8_21_14_2_50_45_7]